MARNALIKLRRGSGLPANNVLEEGELAIDIAQKKLYSADALGTAFTVSGDQYNLIQGGNGSFATLTLTVDNEVLSNDSVTFVGGNDITVSGNSTSTLITDTSTLDSVTGRGSITTNAIEVGNTTIAGFANITSNLHVVSTSQFDGTVTIGNTSVNVVLSTGGDINASGNLTVNGNTALTGAAVEITGVATVNNTTEATSTSTGSMILKGGLGVAKNVYIGGNLYVEGTTTQVSSTTVTIDDNLIKLAANQGLSGDDIDAVDAGWYMTYDAANVQYYSGVVRDTSDANKAFVFFEGITQEPGGTVTYSTDDLAYVVAIIDGGSY